MYEIGLNVSHLAGRIVPVPDRETEVPRRPTTSSPGVVNAASWFEGEPRVIEGSLIV
jgi:hypothetical protein